MAASAYPIAGAFRSSRLAPALVRDECRSAMTATGLPNLASGRRGATRMRSSTSPLRH